MENIKKISLLKLFELKKMKKILIVLVSLVYSNISLADTYEADFGDRGICDEKYCAPFIVPAFLTCNTPTSKNVVFYTTNEKDTCISHIYIKKYEVEKLKLQYCNLAKEVSKKNISTSDFLLDAMKCK